MRILSPEDGFLGRVDKSRRTQDGETGRALIIPFGLEASVSYGHGTAGGPRAVLHASREVETFDCELWLEPCDRFGLFTRAAEPIPGDVSLALVQLHSWVEEAVVAGFFPLVLGGEHALTAGSIRPFVERFPDLVVLHFDAHADLRDGYQGQHYSHASAMRRCLDYPGVSLVSLGIRNVSREEAQFVQEGHSRIHIFWAHDKKNWSLNRIRELIQGRKVYLSFDVDAFDSSLMPATGTPEPGGVFWDDVMPVLRMVMKHCEVVGADVTELAPMPGFHACDFLTAKLVYKILSYRLADF